VVPQLVQELCNATQTFIDKFTRTCHLNVLKVYNKDGVSCSHYIQHQIKEQLVKYEVEMMQNEMVVFFFFNALPAHLPWKTIKNLS
jgi:hypothetical protein